MKLLRGLGCIGLGVGFLGAPSLAAAEPAARPAEKTTADLPPLTLAPRATPPLHWRVDLARLARDLVRGTNVTFDSLDVVASTTNAGMTANLPVAAASSIDFTRYAMIWRTPNAATLKRGPAAAPLNARGWFKLDGIACAVNERSAGPALEICGPDDSILAYADTLAESTGPLPTEDVLELDLNPHVVWRESLEGLRGSVPDRIDSFVHSPGLTGSLPLRQGLADLSYSFITRLVDAVVDLKRVRVNVAIDAKGGHYRSTLQPSPGSLLEKSLVGARAKPAPSIFWQLSDSLESAWFGSSTLLVPFATPSERSLAFLAAVHHLPAQEPGPASKFVDAAGAVASACVVPDRTFLRVSGLVQPAPPKADAKGAKSSAVFVPPPPASEERHWSIALEDPKATCSTSLVAFAKLYAGLPTDVSSTSTFELVKPGKGVPPAFLIARIGAGKEQHYLALSNRSGFSWLTWADTLPGLGAGLQALSAPPTHRLTPSAELTGLAKTAVLLGGFASRVGIPGITEGTDDELSRASLWLAQDGPSWTIAGTVDPRTVRQTATQYLSNMWGVPNWSKLSEERRNALSRFLDSNCRLGNGKACNTLGVRYADGNDLQKDLDRAHEYLGLGCAAGEGIACINSAFYGASPTEQMSVARRGCELKSPLSCAWYGKWLLESHSLDDHPKGIQNLEFACNGGSGLGCWQLGEAYEEGLGVSKDEAKAVELQTRSCTYSFAAGCIALGNHLANGVGRPANPKLALKSYEVGCKLDAKSGCYALGFAYARGIGGEKDLKTARVHWARSCDAGHAEACRMLAETTETP